MKSLEKLIPSALLAVLFTVLAPTTRISAQEGHDRTAERPRGLQPVRASVNLGSAVTLQLAFECVKFQGDCGKVHVLKPSPAHDRPWLQGTGVSPAKALEGDVVEDGVFTLEPGTFVNAKIAYINDTNTEVRFRAIPHSADPYELQRLGLLNCLCLGETYRVPPGQGWFRIIRMGAARDVPPGSRMKVTHVMTSDGLE